VEWRVAKKGRLHALSRTYSNQRFTSTSDVTHPHTTSALTTISYKNESHDPNTSALTFTRRFIHSPTSLEKMGLHQSRVLQVLCTDKARLEVIKQSKDSDIVREEIIYVWETNRFGFGIRLTRIRPYRSIMPSLTTYPIVSFYLHHFSLFSRGNISEIQQAFHSGMMHPFARDRLGRTLLHICFLMTIKEGEKD
jgi:hypothetical protein